MIKTLQNFFAEYDFDFVLLFGSNSTNSAHNLSDIDVGIFTKNKLNLQEIGYISALLASKMNQKIDLVLLNKIEQKNPNFAFSILENHQPILLNNEKSYINFKTKVQLSYLDHKGLIEQNFSDLEDRIESGNYARRNYA